MNKTGSERRKVRRRPVLETFSVFVVVPKKGIHRLRLFDMSEDNLGFELDLEDEPRGDFEITVGMELDVRFYMNQSLYLPLTVEVNRVGETGTIRRVGAEFQDKSSKAYHAFAMFLKILDGIVDVAQIEQQPQ